MNDDTNRPDRALGAQGAQPEGAQDRPHPGDDAPAGTPGTGEDLCPECSGTGLKAGAPCQNCGGTGKIVEAIGGG